MPKPENKFQEFRKSAHMAHDQMCAQSTTGDLNSVAVAGIIAALLALVDVAAIQAMETRRIRRLLEQDRAERTTELGLTATLDAPV